ncbi:unnamed protein product [Spirodela intermedia]|uniref:CID domain-containing protein n=1 Tax=Spirodela intermedia TaxID=51605 RepID=A0A7I8JID5_SPIIN|nr:unnamed protein product [Spirodela intermedia]CAA6669182.1 unnamed protein product [Spirodela intermedia]
MTNIFSTQILAEKLAKLNNSQQSIETLSHWCIFHRKKARQVVETWEKQFNGSKEQRVSFLYLANDILQNSRRKGSEFVNEFWKVLPRALKNVVDNGDEHGKNVVTRLVDIWDERKVFGSRSKSLKDEMMAKRDFFSLNQKLAVGGMPEKVVTAFQAVHDEHVNEDVAVHRFQAAIQQVVKMEKDAVETYSQGNQETTSLVNGLQEQEDILSQCIEQLESVEASREALVFQLKEALQDQESKLELVRSQLKVTRSERERAINLKQRLSGPTLVVPGSGSKLPTASIAGSTLTATAAEAAAAAAAALEPVMPVNPPQLQPVTSFAPFLTTAEVQHKKAAAEVAAKLTASTSSAQMLTSVLSSLVAEEAASMNGLNKPGGYTAGGGGGSAGFPLEKRPKLEKPMTVSEMGNIFFSQLQQQQQPVVSIPLAPPQASGGANVQPISQKYQHQPPLPPPPPPLTPPPQVQQQYAQSSSAMVGVLPYGYGTSPLPPLPHLPSNIPMNMARPSAPQPPPPPPPPQQQQHEQPVFYQAPGIGFYGQPSAASVPRQ